MDDYTHFVTLYLIRHKSEVFEKFKEYNAMVTAHFGLKISRLRRDNGTEYTSKEFLSFCKSQGIVDEPTVAYTPEQNGVSERLNRTLVEKARTMMIESGVSNELWGEAILCATYLTNRSPCSVYNIPYIIPNLKISNAQNPENSKSRNLKIPTNSKSRKLKIPTISKF
jgi:transposase InsO family protein